MSQICDSCFFVAWPCGHFLVSTAVRSYQLAVIVGSGFALGTYCAPWFNDRVVIFWYKQQYVPTVELAALVALGFALGTPCTRGLGLRPQDSLCSWNFISLLHQLPNPPAECNLTIGAAKCNPNYQGSQTQP